MSNPFQLTIPLKQHTPIVHFQHYLHGASLRATDVKPALDTFLKQYFASQNVSWSNWRVGQTEALDYKLQIINKGASWRDEIEQSKKENGAFVQQYDRNTGLAKTKTDPYPGYFANMGRDYNEFREIKKFIFSDHLELVFFSFHTDFIGYLKADSHALINRFFAAHNFGSRKNRGFGSYYPTNQELNFSGFDYCFDVKLTNSQDKRIFFKELFRHIDLFARALRGGINLKAGSPDNQRDVLYIKSFLFSYFKEIHQIQWEKKAIKQAYLTNELAEQQRNRPDSEALQFSSQQVYLVKDLLGLATEESWHSYRKSFEKVEATRQGGQFAEKNKDNRIERAPSPFFFKPVQLAPSHYRVYIRLQEESFLAGKSFVIKPKGRQNGQWGLSMPNTFSVRNFFKYVFENKERLVRTMEVNLTPRDREDQIIEVVFQSFKPC